MSNSLPKSKILDEFTKFVNLEVNKYVTPKPFDPKGEDFAVFFQKLYKNGDFCDLEIRSSSSGDTIKVHKLFLIKNGFKSVEKCLQPILTIDANKQLIENLVESYYYQKFDFKLDSSNIEEYIEIAKQLGNEELIDYLTNHMKDLESMNTTLSQVFDELKTSFSLKRKSDFQEITPKKISIAYTPIETLPETEVKTPKNMADEKHIDNNIDIEKNGTNDTNHTMDSNESLVSNEDKPQPNTDVSQTVESLENCGKTEKKMPLTTEIYGFIPEEEESDNILVIDESPVPEETQSYPQTNEELKKTLAKINHNKLNSSMNFTKIINSVTKKSTRSPVLESQTQMELRRSSRKTDRQTIINLDPKFKPTFNPVIKNIKE